MNESCFGRRKGRVCSILIGGVCHGNYDRCPFYKPAWMAERDREKALRRISEMPIEKQRRISEKYYQGKMPWAKEGL